MQTSVTQNLAVRVVPVNNPLKSNDYGEQLGYYRAYVAGGDSRMIEHAFTVAEQEIHRGIVPMNVGYGHASNALAACEHAIGDYIAKFGALAVADTNDN